MSLESRLRQLEESSNPTAADDWRAQRLAAKRPVDVEALARELDLVEQECAAIRATVRNEPN